MERAAPFRRRPQHGPAAEYDRGKPQPAFLWPEAAGAEDRSPGGSRSGSLGAGIPAPVGARPEQMLEVQSGRSLASPGAQADDLRPGAGDPARAAAGLGVGPRRQRRGGHPALHRQLAFHRTCAEDAGLRPHRSVRSGLSVLRGGPCGGSRGGPRIEGYAHRQRAGARLGKLLGRGARKSPTRGLRPILARRRQQIQRQLHAGWSIRAPSGRRLLVCLERAQPRPLPAAAVPGREALFADPLPPPVPGGPGGDRDGFPRQADPDRRDRPIRRRRQRQRHLLRPGRALSRPVRPRDRHLRFR